MPHLKGKIVILNENGKTKLHATYHYNKNTLNINKLKIK